MLSPSHSTECITVPGPGPGGQRIFARCKLENILCECPLTSHCKV